MVPEKVLVLRSRICKLLRSPISGPNWPETSERVKLREATLLESSQVMPNQLHGVAEGDEFGFHVEVTSFGTFSRCFRSESRVSPSELRQETDAMWVVETKRQKRRRLSSGDRRFFFILDSKIKNHAEAKIKIGSLK